MEDTDKIGWESGKVTVPRPSAGTNILSVATEVGGKPVCFGLKFGNGSELCAVDHVKAFEQIN